MPGDDPVDIASGPIVPDASTCDSAQALVRGHGIALPEAARGGPRLARQPRGRKPEARRCAPGPRRGAHRRRTAGLARSRRAFAQTAGYAAHIPGYAIDGEARDVGCVLAGIALQVARRGQPFAAPCALLSGGDTTVSVRGTGRGGRNVEALLSCALTLGDHPRIHALMEDTDGVDGLEEIAGAHATPDTLAGARAG